MKTRILKSFTVIAATASILSAQAGSGEASARDRGTSATAPAPHVAEGYSTYAAPGGPVVVPRAVNDGAEKAREVISDLLAYHHKAIEISRIAEATTTNAEVRSFAEATIATNTAAREGLDNLMKSIGPVAKTPPANTFDEREWRMKKAEEFNEDYADAMVDVHEELVDLYESAAKSDHSGLAAHAQASITGIKLHLERAKLLEEAQD